VQSDSRPEVATDIRSGESAPLSADVWIGADLRPVVASARRRATRDADRQADTAHLLHSLLESDPRCRDALARAAASTGHREGQVARVLAYLAQRSIGYGMRWRGAVEDAGARPAAGGAAVPGLSPAAGAVLSEAVMRAATDGRAAAEGADLLAALAADPACRAAVVLRAVGVDPRAVVSAAVGGGLAASR
jgi:ATP-dependent Clp protease ATP-binding subunit ClpA